MGVGHPVPSAINAIAVVALAFVAGAGVATAATLAVAMLGFQVSIGALNDLVDADTDRVSQPQKPIPSGLVAPRTAGVIVLVGGATGIGLSATFGVVVLALGLAGYACGVAYDLALRERGLAWACYAAALPLLLAWTWMAVAGTLPPGWPLLLPVAALAGPALHLANSLVDAEGDERIGRPSLATRLGPKRARQLLTVLLVTVGVLAWLTLLSRATMPTIALALGLASSVAIAAGTSLSWRRERRILEIGWLLVAVGLVGLAVAWLAALPAGA